MRRPGNLQRAYDEVTAKFGSKLTAISAERHQASFTYADRSVTWQGPGRISETPAKPSSDPCIETEGLAFPDFDELVKRARVALADPSTGDGLPVLTILPGTDWKRARHAELRLDTGTATLDSTLQPFADLAVDELDGLRQVVKEFTTLTGVSRASLLSLDAHVNQNGATSPEVAIHADNQAGVTGTTTPPVMVLERQRRARRGGPNSLLSAITPEEYFTLAELNLELLYKARDLAMPNGASSGWSASVRRLPVVGGDPHTLTYGAYGAEPSQSVFLDGAGRVVNVARS